MRGDPSGQNGPIAGRYLALADVAGRFGVSVDKVASWIKTGELRAINVARRGNGRPRWRIAPADLAIFESVRAATPVESGSRRRRQQPPGVIEFFK
jgi:hypothetical protein